MSDDLQTLLRPLRELEPTSDELARAEAAIHDQGRRTPATGARRALRLRPFGRRRLAVLAAASLATAAAVVALPAGDDDSLRSALRAAAAAAAEAPAGAPFTGYRHIVERVREEHSGSPPREYLREVWIDAQWRGVERTDAGGGTRPRTMSLPIRSGPFGAAPLAELPTDPDALLRALDAAYDDGSFAAPGSAWMEQPNRDDADSRRAEMASSTAWLIVESNATPELRAAGFGVLERLGGARDLGTIRDAEGRAGRGLEITWGGTVKGDRWSSALRLIFDPAAGEVLSVRMSGTFGDERHLTELTYLRAEQTRSLPPGASGAG